MQSYQLIACCLTQTVHNCQADTALVHALSQNNIRLRAVEITQQIEQIGSQLLAAVAPACQLQLLLLHQLCQLALQRPAAQHADGLACCQRLSDNLRKLLAGLALKQIYRRLRRIMAVLHARCLRLKVFISLQGRVNLDRAHNLRQHLVGDAAGTQNRRHRLRRIDNRRFQTYAAAAAVKHAGNFALHILEHILRIRRTRTTGNISRRCRNRTAAGTDKVLRKFIRRKAYSNCFQTGTYCVRHDGRFIDNQSQRSRPKMLDKLLGISVQACRQRRNCFLLCNMQNQRIIIRPSLSRKNFGYGRRIQSVCAQAVHCFRREGNNLACLNQRSSLLHCFFILRVLL